MDTNPYSVEGRWHLVAKLATRQAGRIAMWQLRFLGVGTDEIQHRVHRDGWSRDFRSVLRMPGVPNTLDGRLWAAVLAVGDIGVASRAAAPLAEPHLLGEALADRAALTAFSAANKLGFDRYTPAVVQVVAPWEVVCRRRGIRVVRSRRGIAGFWRWVDGLPVAISARIMWDAAHLSTGLVGGWRRVADLAIFLDQTRQFAVDQLVGLVDEPFAYGLPRRPPPLLRAVANELRPGFSHSGTEAKARRIAETVAAEIGLTLEPRPHPVTNADGVPVGEADIACKVIRFDAEIDGPHHDYPSQKVVDARRDRRMRKQGWTVKRYSHRLIDDNPEEFRRLLRRDMLAALAAHRAGQAA